MTAPHIEKEDIAGDRPLYHVFYANDTKSKQFARRKDAEAFISEMRHTETNARTENILRLQGAYVLNKEERGLIIDALEWYRGSEGSMMEASLKRKTQSTIKALIERLS